MPWLSRLDLNAVSILVEVLLGEPVGLAHWRSSPLGEAAHRDPEHSHTEQSDAEPKGVQVLALLQALAVNLLANKECRLIKADGPGSRAHDSKRTLDRS